MPNSPYFTGERPSPPSNWTRTNWTIGQARAAGFFPPNGPAVNVHDGIGYEFTWHHNIPWKTLRDSWKIIVVFCDWEIVEDLLLCYGQYHNYRIRDKIRGIKAALTPTRTNASGATYEKHVARMGGGTESLLGSVEDRYHLTNEEADALEFGIAWQGWNINEGPKESIRVEDPGSDGFDDFSRCDAGRYARYITVERLNMAFDDLISDYNARKAQFADHGYIQASWDTPLRNTVRAVKGLRNERPVPFNPAHWRVMHWGGGPIVKDLSGKPYWMVRTKRDDE